MFSYTINISFDQDYHLMHNRVCMLNQAHVSVLFPLFDSVSKIDWLQSLTSIEQKKTNQANKLYHLEILFSSRVEKEELGLFEAQKKFKIYMLIEITDISFKMKNFHTWCF